MPHPDALFDIFLFLFTGHPLTLAVSLVLLVFSAAFSSCETALFSLSAPELNRIRAGKNRFDRAVNHLAANLQSLLPTLLFCNMAVNVLIYSLSASMAAGLGDVFGGGVAFGFSLASLFLVVFLGEVFPKQMAISSSLMMARITALPVYLLYQTLRKPLRILNSLVSGLERAAGHGAADPRELREEELRLLVELSRKDGAISEGEFELIDGVVELPAVRVRDIMIPRVDVAPLAPGVGPKEALATARKSGHCKLPLLDAGLTEPVGWIDARDICADLLGREAKTGGSLAGYVRKFQFFSEHDRADQVLERIKGDDRDLYAVVDERGQIAGFFTLQDIMDEVLGPFGEHGAPLPSEIREEGGEYIISGRFSVREWRERFDVSTCIPRSATVGGLVHSLLGRIARVGDKVRLGNVEMTVRSMRRNRVAEVGLRLIRNPKPSGERRDGA